MLFQISSDSARRFSRTLVRSFKMNFIVSFEFAMSVSLMFQYTTRDMNLKDFANSAAAKPPIADRFYVPIVLLYYCFQNLLYQPNTFSRCTRKSRRPVCRYGFCVRLPKTGRQRGAGVFGQFP